MAELDVAADVLRMIGACCTCHEMKSQSSFLTGKKRWLQCAECRGDRLRSTRSYVKRAPGTPRGIRYHEAKKENPAKHMFYRVKYRAIKEGTGFSIAIDDIFIPTHCPILGIKLAEVGSKLCDATPSLDRVDSSIGYAPGNVAVISMKANRMKGDATIADYERIIAYMRAHGCSR